MTQEEKNKIKNVLSNVFMEIKNGHIERAWEVYDKIESQLKELLYKN